MEVIYIKDFNIIKDNFNFINEDEKKYYLEDENNIKEYILKNYDEKIINNYFIRYYEIINEYIMKNTNLMITLNNKKWFVVLFKNGLYFEDIFNINDIIFINIKMINEINKMEINNNFLINLAISKLNTLYCNNLNYCINNFNMKESNVKFLKQNNYVFDNEIIEFKDFSLIHLKDYQKMILASQQALQAQGHHSSLALFLSGISMYELEQYPQAVAFFQKAFEGGLKEGIVLEYMGEALEKFGKLEESRNVLSAAQRMGVDREVFQGDDLQLYLY